jgi:hypothetical protein
VTLKNELGFPHLGELPAQACISQTALELPEKLTFEEWRSVGLSLGKVEQSAQWWWGDWWRFAEERAEGGNWSGRRKELVESGEWDGPEFNTCISLGSVCRAFSTNLRRRVLLSFRHHKELASLDSAEADSLLDWCEAPLKNGRKKAKSIRELHEEMARRANAELEQSAIAAVEQFLSEYGDIEPKKFAQAKQIGIDAIRQEIRKQNEKKTMPTIVKLSRVMTEAIEKYLGPVRGDLHAYMNFIGPIRNLAEMEISDFDLIAMAQSEALLTKDKERCEKAISKIKQFLNALKKRFN